MPSGVSEHLDAAEKALAQWGEQLRQSDPQDAGLAGREPGRSRGDGDDVTHARTHR